MVAESLTGNTCGWLYPPSSAGQVVGSDSAAPHVAVGDFVAFLSRRVELRHSKGLELLAKAFAAGETTALCSDLIDEFINDASNVVIFAKKLDQSATSPPQSAAASSPMKKCPHGDLNPATEASYPESKAQLALKEKAEELEQLSITLKGKRKGFAQKWIAIIEKAPWTRWAATFVPFLPPTSPGRIQFNHRLQGFFHTHGQAMWERYFCLPDRESPKSTTRLRAAIQAFGLLVHELYVVEGVAVFVFLAHYPHPSWPILSEHSLLPYNFPGTNFLRYVEAEHMKRWPSCVEYWKHSKSSLRQHLTTYQPLAFLDWAAKFTLNAHLAFKWTFAQTNPRFFADLRAAVDATAFDADKSPYISVVSEPLPPTWSFPNGPQTKLKWTSGQKCPGS